MLTAHGQRRGADIYWLNYFAAQPGELTSIETRLAVMASPQCCGGVALLNLEHPGVCAFRSSWCLMELSAAVQEARKRDSFHLDLAAFVPKGAVKFGDATKGLGDIPSSVVVQYQEGQSFRWERGDSRAAWPTWTIREGLGITYDSNSAQVESQDVELARSLLLKDLRRHLRKRLASAAIYGAAGGRPLCPADIELLELLTKEFPEAVNEPMAFGETALFRAAAWGCPEAVKILLAAKADVERRREDQLSILGVARARGVVEVLKLLHQEFAATVTESEVRSLDIVALQDDIPWAAAVPIPQWP